MARGSEVHPNDQERIGKMLEKAVNGKPVDNKREARRLISELDHLDSNGHTWAGRALRSLSIDGALRLVAAHVKRDQGTILVTRTGEVVSMPARFGLRKRRKDGKLAPSYQQTFWWELGWDDFLRLIQAITSQRDILGQRIDAMNEILKLREEFPDTLTPGEACERKGIDPRQYMAEAS